MADNLVIVESPAKAKTIEKYLGPGYKVLASYGHIRDLPRSDFAVVTGDVPDEVELTYEVPSASKKHVTALRKEAKGDTRVWLATDLDREGEAIAWHVAEIVDLDVADTPRVVFDEITEGAILAAFDAPRTLDTHLVDAQQARRAVDRIVGYRLSPVLWRTVSSGISAGRVQSVALRLITDREDEIRAFVPEEYWSFDGVLEGEQPPPFEARLYSVADERIVSAKKWEETDEARRDGLRSAPRTRPTPSWPARRTSTTASPRSSAPSASASPTPRSRPRPCRARPPSVASRPARPWRSPSSCTRASSSGGSRPV